MCCCFYYTLCQARQLKSGWSLEQQWRGNTIQHATSDKLPPPIRENLLSFHALTGYDTNSTFSGHGKMMGWKMFKSQPLLVSGIGGDGELALVEQFMYLLYGATTLSDVDILDKGAKLPGSCVDKNSSYPSNPRCLPSAYDLCMQI